jgi:hypothetical protein
MACPHRERHSRQRLRKEYLQISQQVGSEEIMEGEEVLTVSGSEAAAADTAAVSDEPIVGTDDGGLDLDTPEPEPTPDGKESEEQKTEDKPADKEEPELSDFRGAVSGRIRAFIKQAPELGRIFKQYPAIQSQIESTFRREAAMREIFPTVAEARTMKEYFPNGAQDVKTLLSEREESEAVDNAFYNPGQDGSYPFHSKLLDDMFKDNQNATVALFKTLPKEWARLDRASYNEVMSKVVAATLVGKNIPAFLGSLAVKAKGTELEAGINQLLDWVEGYTAERAPSDEERRLADDRAKFNKERSDADAKTKTEFQTKFVAEAKALQLGIIDKHPIMMKLKEIKSLTDEKRADIAEKVRANIEKLLSNSPAFMKQLRVAHSARNLPELEKIQRAAWSQPWLLKSMIRTVLKKEVPQLVSNNREVAARRTGTPAPRTPANPGDKSRRPAGPYQVGGRWYKQSGEPFTVAEVVAGKHQQS